MKITNASLPAALFAFALVACQQADPNNIAIDEANNAAAMDVDTVPPSENAGDPNIVGGLNEADDAGSDQPSPPDTPESKLIPSAFRGRWGINAADCDRTRSDAKGAITIGEKTIRFYEATATLGKITLNAPENFTGNFAFSGEGQTWNKSVNLKLTGSSNILERTDDEGSYTYARCKA